VRRLITGSVLVMLLAGCSGTSGSTAQSAAPSPGTPTSQAASGEVDGMFDVGGYKLHLVCKGTGSPTVVYFDGLGGGSTPQVMSGLATRLTDRHRFCSYDRVNTGGSGTEQAMHTGADSVRDLHTLLAAADVRGPYLLVGWSWGGVLASMYAGTHPDDVMGILLLDSALPTDDEIEALMPPAELAQLKTEWNAVEREDLYLTLAEAKPLMKSVPDVPVTFLAAAPPAPANEVDKRMQALRTTKRAEFVEQFRQGRLVPVKSSHDIGLEEPDLVVAEVRRIVTAP
jgi:pimeloyl-ACP methyl ester carboxylesterase